jgi:RHS repeat-associated protein
MTLNTLRHDHPGYCLAAMFRSIFLRRRIRGHPRFHIGPPFLPHPVSRFPLIFTPLSRQNQPVLTRLSHVTSESNAANGDRFQFDGMQFDQALGMYYDNARYYDPATGRFLSPDPMGFAAGDANLYRFTGNSPTNRIDTTGLAWYGDIAKGAWNAVTGVLEIPRVAIDLQQFQYQTTSVFTNWAFGTPVYLYKPQSYLVEGLFANADRNGNDLGTAYNYSFAAGFSVFLEGSTFGLHSVAQGLGSGLRTGNYSNFWSAVGASIVAFASLGLGPLAGKLRGGIKPPASALKPGVKTPKRPGPVLVTAPKGKAPNTKFGADLPGQPTPSLESQARSPHVAEESNPSGAWTETPVVSATPQSTSQGAPRPKVEQPIPPKTQYGTTPPKGPNGSAFPPKTNTASAPNTIVTAEMESKILLGQRVVGTNRIIGGHSGAINDLHPNYAVEELSTNPNGTRVVKFITQFADGSISKIKKSTLFPESWSDAQVIDAVKQVGNSPALQSQLSNHATVHRAIVNGIEIEVLKIGDEVISAYPTGL